MAEKIALELDINAKGATTSLGQLEQEAERLNEELRKVPLGSKAFKDLKTELVGVNKQIKNTELSMEALDNEQVASELGSVAGAVGDVSAAFILLGGGGGALEDTVKNIEKAIGVSMAFKGAIEGTQSAMKLFNNVVKNSTFLQKANNAVTVIASGVMKLFTGSVNTTSIAFKGLRTAIAATGIGLLVVGVGALVANFDKIKAALSGVSDAANDLQKATALRSETNQKNLDALDNQTNILKLQGKTEREILKMKIDARKKVVDGLIAEIEAQKLINKQQLEGSKRNQKILQKTIEFIFIIPRTILKLLNFVGDGFTELINNITQSKIGKKLFGIEPISIELNLDKKADELIESASKLLFDPEATEKEGKKELEALENNLLKQRNALAGHKLAVLDLDKKAAEKVKTQQDKAQNEADKKAEEARAKTIAERTKEAQDLVDFLLAKENLENEYLDGKLSKEQQEVNAVREKYFQLLELARINGEDTAILEEAQQSQINEIKKRFADEEAEIQAAKNKKILEDQLALENTKLQMASDGIGALMNLTSAFAKDNEKSQKRAFEINKRLQIAQAIIQTYQGANAVFASTAANPLTIVNPSAPFIAAGIAILNGLANVQTIRKQQFQASSPGGGGQQQPNFGVGGGTPPPLQPANTSMLTNQQPNRVFVTETDITAIQNQVAVIQGQSTIL